MNEYVNTVINQAFRVVPLANKEIEYTKTGYTTNNKTELIRVATKKKILPVVAKHMCSLGVDTEEWMKQYQFFFNRNKKIIEQIDNVFGYLHSKGIFNIAAYENFGALLYSDTDVALYSSGDVDLFADVEQKEAIVNAMIALGYVPTKDINHERNLMTEFCKKDTPVRVNIGWKALRRYSLPILVDIETVVDWDKLFAYKNTNIRLLSKEALLYLCFLRIAVHGYSRSPDVRLYIDTSNVVCTKPDWNTVIQWAKKDGTLTKFVTVAYIANQLNGVEIPEMVLTMAKNDKYSRKIMRIVYDEKKRTLKYNPTGMKLLRMEAASDRKTIFGECFTMLFPPKRWLKEFYLGEGEQESQIYSNYYKRFFDRKF